MTLLQSPPVLRDGAITVVMPQWFAMVMGTGIVGNAAVSLPGIGGAIAQPALWFWLMACVLLLVLAVRALVTWTTPGALRALLDDPASATGFGTVPMALLTVAAGALLVGGPLLGRTAVPAAVVLWTAGTVLGLLVAIVVPRRVADAPQVAGAVLLPVVPPMVSAATGPLLVPHLPNAAARQGLWGLCLVLFAIAVWTSAGAVVRLGSRWASTGLPGGAAVPSLWIVLGPLGQSATAAHTLGAAARQVFGAKAGVLASVGLAYAGVIVVVALVWLAVAGAATLRAVGTGLAFTPAWWAFTFPLGTVVTGLSGLAASTGAALPGAVAIAVFVGLIGAWGVVATASVRGLVAAGSRAGRRALGETSGGSPLDHLARSRV